MASPSFNHTRFFSRERLYRYHPRFNDARFWIVQALVISIAVVHDFVEGFGYLSNLGLLYFVPASLFILPVVYAGLVFGLPGSISSAIWVIIITIPNWLFWHHGMDRWGVIFQMTLILGMAILVGQRVDREKKARREAEEAGAALKTYAAHLVKLQEEERQRVARELHDDVIQTLSLVHRRLGGLEARTPPLDGTVIKEITDTKDMTDNAIKGLRDFTRTLRPPILDDLGMVASIRRLVMDLTERNGLEGNFKMFGQDRRLPPDLEAGMFRIAQEALWNVEQHSKANRVDVILTLAPKKASLDIVDDGTGFQEPPVERESGRGLGLLGMRERAEMLSGKLTILSRPGKGTKVSVSVPVN